MRNSEITSFELDQILDLLLRILVEVISCQAASISISSGERSRIEALWGLPEELKGVDFLSGEITGSDAHNNFEPRIIHTIVADEPWSIKISNALGQRLEALLVIPIASASQFLGEVVFMSTRKDSFTDGDLTRAANYIARIAPAIENAIIFSETGRYLHRLSLLNELALAASEGAGTDVVASRAVRRLRRIFNIEQVAVLLLAEDGNTLLEYGGTEGVPPLVIPVGISLAGFVVEKKLPMRLGDIREAPRFYPPSPEVHSALFVPLMYQGEVIGTVCLQSNKPNAFTDRDEQLLVVIASHLAGLFENVRLNQEARERAGKLSLIHQVAQRLVGLTDEEDIARLTAELTADYFKYELTAVLLVDSSGESLRIAGVGGSMAHLVPGNFIMPTTKGITGRVFREAKGGFYNDVSRTDVYFPLPGWYAGSELCVPLLDGSRVFGVLNVERIQKQSFTDSDLQLLESLAGFLSSVILSARRYRELQERIEAQRQAENHMIRSARLAAVGEMAAGIAHELNNPLTSVIGFVELALEDLPRESTHFSDLDLALHEAKRAREVVRNLLDFSRQGSNIRIPVDLNELLSEVLKLLNHQFKSLGVEIKLSLGEISLILANPNQIKQVAINLLQNALQAMPDGGIVAVTTGQNDTAGKQSVYLTIRDTGEGIPPDALERIFEPFFTTRTVGQGTGLGLSVSFGIVTSHGGQIEVISEMGIGSAFTVWLPTHETSYDTGS